MASLSFLDISLQLLICINRQVSCTNDIEVQKGVQLCRPHSVRVDIADCKSQWHIHVCVIMRGCWECSWEMRARVAGRSINCMHLTTKKSPICVIQLRCVKFLNFGLLIFSTQKFRSSIIRKSASEKKFHSSVIFCVTLYTSLFFMRIFC